MNKLPPSTACCIPQDLVVRARVDREAFGELYDAVYPSIFRYCLRRVGNRSVAEDITSTVFLRVANKIAGFEDETYEGFRKWVFTIATNEINADYRKTNRRKTLSDQAALSGRLVAPTNHTTEENQTDDAVQVAILKLSQRAQAIITMRFYSELSYDDIGEILNISPGAARTAASRALDTIRRELRTE